MYLKENYIFKSNDSTTSFFREKIPNSRIFENVSAFMSNFRSIQVTISVNSKLRKIFKTRENPRTKPTHLYSYSCPVVSRLRALVRLSMAVFESSYCRALLANLHSFIARAKSSGFRAAPVPTPPRNSNALCCSKVTLTKLHKVQAWTGFNAAIALLKCQLTY